MEPELEKLLNEILSNQKKIIKALKIEELESTTEQESMIDKIEIVITKRD